jgi:hypothetical protein
MRARRPLHLEDIMPITKKNTKERTRVVTVRVPEDTYRQLKILAATKGKDNAAVVTDAIATLAAQEGGAQ